MKVLPMQESDLEEVVALEQRSFTEPWTPKMFLGELRDNVFATNLVARAENQEWSEVSEGVLVGYSMFWVVFEELHLMNLAVRPELRRLGIARELVRQTLSIAAAKGAHRAFLEVRASNVAAQGLPGILGRDGWLATSELTQGTFICRLSGVTTAVRLDVHFWWNIGETMLLLLAGNMYLRQFAERRPLRSTDRMPATAIT